MVVVVSDFALCSPRTTPPTPPQVAQVSASGERYCVSDLCSKSEETVILWARSDTKIKDVFSLADTELEEKKNLTQMFQIVKFRIKSQISNLF